MTTALIIIAATFALTAVPSLIIMAAVSWHHRRQDAKYAAFGRWLEDSRGAFERKDAA